MAYAKACAAVDLRAHGLCEGATPACPDGVHRGTVHHHRRLRSQGGEDSPANLVLLCEAAHLHVHAHPAESYASGLMLRTEHDLYNDHPTEENLNG